MIDKLTDREKLQALAVADKVNEIVNKVNALELLANEHSHTFLLDLGRPTIRK